MDFKFIKPRFIQNFLVSFSSGLLIHLYMITNKLPLADDVAFSLVKNNGCSLSSGRWFLDYYNLSAGWNIPLVRSFLSLLFGSIAIVLLIDLWGIKNKVITLLFAAAFWAFPFNASIFSQMYMVDAYFCGILLGILGCYLFIKYHNIFCFIFSSVCFACSTGIYQSLIQFSIMCYLCTFLLYALSQQKNFFDLFKRALTMCFSLVCGILMYKVLLTEELTRKKVELTDYQGINSMGEFSFSSIFTGIKTAFYSYYQYFFSRDSYGFNTSLIIIINLITILLFLLFFIFFLIRIKNISNVIFSIICLLIWPIAINFIYIMAPSAHIYTLQKTQYLFLYILLASLLDLFIQSDIFQNNCKAYICYFAVFILVGNIFSGFLTINKIYYKLQLNFYSAYAYYVELMSNLKNEDSFDYNKPIIFIGNPEEHISMSDTGLIDEICGFGWSFSNQDLIQRPAYGQIFCETYLGVKTSSLSPEELIELINSSEYKNAQCYPYDGFSFEYNNNLIIKLGEYEY